MNATRTLLGRFSASVADGIDTTPTIRPVIDMSAVESGINNINGLFDANRTMNAGRFTGAIFNRGALRLNIDGARITGTSNNRDVVSAINTLTEKFNSLSDAVTSMQLVLDTGTLVGAIDTKIDKRLGMLAGRRERGN